MADTATISVSALRVRYGARIALDGVDLTVDTGITALLGPNGAGKTTLLSTLTGRRPTSGKVQLAGHDLNDRRQRLQARRFVGYLPQHFDLHGGLTVGDTVWYACWCNGLRKSAADKAAQSALEVTELAAKAGERVRTISGGERQRLGLACSIVHRPSVLLLDEPTVGLDPEQRIRFRHYLSAISTSSSILLTTHLLSDVAVLADRLIVLSSGRVAFSGTPDELADRGEPDKPAETALESGYRSVLKAMVNDE